MGIQCTYIFPNSNGCNRIFIKRRKYFLVMESLVENPHVS